ncbi:MAG: HNH endonuclease signature motif containing protein [Ilumatobacteraceae bacterium]
MTWLKIGDEIATCPEWLAIEDHAYRLAGGDHVAARRLAANAKHVHTSTSTWGAKALCDGNVPRSAVAQICALGSISEADWYDGAKLLQLARMWDHRRSAPWRMIVMWRDGDQPTSADEEARKRRGRRRQALTRKDAPKRLDAIARAEGRCEYCDAKLTETTGEIDHVDDDGWNELENLAWVCGRCNKRKGARTLAEARMAFTARAQRLRDAWTVAK